MTTKHELSKDNDVHSQGGWGKTTKSQPHTAEEVRNVQSRRKSLPQGRAQKMLIQYQWSVVRTYIYVT